jgi:hypothetical protein
MSKILLTGMTAPQVSSRAHDRSLSFAGVLKDVLTNMGHDVTWGDPDLVSFEPVLKEFDAVLVGLAPITSLSANRAYGALSVVDTLWSSGKLFMFIDSPSVSQIGTSLRATINSPDNLTKDFFSYRKHYEEVKSSPAYQAIMLRAISKLLNEDWPVTFYSSLPWSSDDDVYASLPESVGDCLIPLNIDSFLASTDSPDRDVVANKWSYDIPTPHWTKKQLKMVALPGSPMKVNKGATDSDVYMQIQRSVGSLISPDKRQGTWWTYRYIQSLNAGVPVVTEWKESFVLGPSWSVLAASVEEMTSQERSALAASQKEAYLSSIPSKIEVTNILNETMNL